MKFTIELDIGLSFLLQVALPQLETDRVGHVPPSRWVIAPERRRLIVVGVPSDRGHCRRRTEIPEAEPLAGTPPAHRHLSAVAAALVSRKTRPMKCPMRGRQPGHPPLPPWWRKHASHATPRRLSLRTKSRRLRRRESASASREKRAPVRKRCFPCKAAVPEARPQSDSRQ